MSYERKCRPRLDCLTDMSLPLPRSGVHYGRGVSPGTTCTRRHLEDQTTEKCRTRKHMWYVKTHQYVPRDIDSRQDKFGCRLRS